MTTGFDPSAYPGAPAPPMAPGAPAPPPAALPPAAPVPDMHPGLPPAPVQMPQQQPGAPSPWQPQQQPAAPAPPAPATAPVPPQLQPASLERAQQWYAQLENPASQPEAVLAVARQYGFAPDAIESPDELKQALAMYADFKRQEGGANAGPGTVPPDAGYFDPDAFQANMLGQMEALLQRRDAQARLEQQQAAIHQQNVVNLQDAVGGVAQQAGLTDEQHQYLLTTIATDIDARVARGEQIDFSPQGMQQHAAATLQFWRSMAGAQQQATINGQVAQHRGAAPLTTVPTGPGMAGGPPGMPGQARGFAGAQQRALAGLGRVG